MENNKCKSTKDEGRMNQKEKKIIQEAREIINSEMEKIAKELNGEEK